MIKRLQQRWSVAPNGKTHGQAAPATMAFETYVCTLTVLVLLKQKHVKYTTHIVHHKKTIMCMVEVFKEMVNAY